MLQTTVTNLSSPAVSPPSLCLWLTYMHMHIEVSFLLWLFAEILDYKLETLRHFICKHLRTDFLGRRAFSFIKDTISHTLKKSILNIADILWFHFYLWKNSPSEQGLCLFGSVVPVCLEHSPSLFLHTVYSFGEKSLHPSEDELLVAWKWWASFSHPFCIVFCQEPFSYIHFPFYSPSSYSAICSLSFSVLLFVISCSSVCYL